jgi:MYXO-CTERM domain-containing protein
MKTNPMKHPAVAAVTLALSMAASPAATLLSTDMQSLPTGAVTASNLTSVTTGGTWSLNTGRGASYSIVEDSIGSPTGDRALLMDDPDLTGNGGTSDFATVTLTAAASFATDAITVATSTGIRRTGIDKTYTYQFEGTGGTVGATITWFGVVSGPESVSFNGGAPVSTGALFLGAWNEESPVVTDISAVFSGGNVTLTWGGLSSGSIPVLNSVSTLETIRFNSGGSDVSRRGIFIDEILVTQVPEPGAAVLGGLGLLCLLRRRR